MDAVQDGVPVRAIEACEEFAGAGIFVEFLLEIIRHCYVPLRFVRLIPPAISSGQFHLPESRGLHLPLFNKFGDLLAVDLRPFASRPSAGESLQPEFIIERPLLAIDPAIAERYIERFLVRNGFDSGILLG